MQIYICNIQIYMFGIHLICLVFMAIIFVKDL